MSYVRRLVENHPCGKLVPQGEGVLDTPEKIKAYHERMTIALEARKRSRKPRHPRRIEE